jgi:hypothetical protein
VLEKVESTLIVHLLIRTTSSTSVENALLPYRSSSEQSIKADRFLPPTWIGFSSWIKAVRVLPAQISLRPPLTRCATAMATAAQPILLDDSDSDVIEVLVINDAAAEELVPDRVDKPTFALHQPIQPITPTARSYRRRLFMADRRRKQATRVGM